MDVEFQEFTVAHYEEAAAFWAEIPEVGLDDADTPENMQRFLARNPGMSFVARHQGVLIGAVLSGHDGRRGYLHHLAVLPRYRGRGIGRRLVEQCLRALASAGIPRCNIFVYADNEQGKQFWRKTGWSVYEGLDLMFRSTKTESGPQNT
ncbi:MAG: GNAT family N-acetyltransferase [Planctomycetota bacterium]|jgi:putative acetyltransferase